MAQQATTTTGAPAAGRGPVIKVASQFPIRGARVIPSRAAKQKQPAEESPVGLGRDMVERLLQNELARAQGEWKQQLEAAKREAYEQGFANGRKETEERLVAQFQRSAQIFKKTAEKLHEETHAVSQEQEQQILRLVLAIARKVVGFEAATNPDTVLEVLRKALRLTNEKSVVRIVTHPADLDHLRSQLEQLHMQFDLPDGVEILADANLEPGGVRIESEHGSVDADIATQFEEISRRMLKDDSGETD